MDDVYEKRLLFMYYFCLIYFPINFGSMSQNKVSIYIAFKQKLMNKIIIAIFSLLVISFSWKVFPVSTPIISINSISKDPPKTVPYVDLVKYMGLWHEQALIPFFLERNCEKTTSSYTLNADQTFQVYDVCYKKGVKSQTFGKAFVDPADTTKSNAKLKVQINGFFGFKSNVWVVRLDKDYTYAVVSSPNYSQMWIYYRQAQMPQALYGSIYNDLKNDGFPVQKLKRTIQ